MFNINNLGTFGLLSMGGVLSPEQLSKVRKIKTAWNFYEGYHWEELPPDKDSPQITENYCRAFVNKFVAFEFGKGFNITIPVEEDGKENNNVITDYLDEVWKDNNVLEKLVEIGQSKSITGDTWVQVKYIESTKENDPLAEYPNGKIKIVVCPTHTVFPEYNEHDYTKLEKVTIAYPIEKKEVSPIIHKTKIRKVVYKQIWTNEYVEEYEGSILLKKIPNIYGLIPFVQIKNFPIVGKEEGMSDLEDIIPLNMELNMKNSDISEIIDYHSAPVTLVFGATVSNLEKGANKVWGGLPRDADVRNLELQSDLGASMNYIKSLKKAMHEIGGIPEGALGGEQAISNTSGVALQFVNMPLIERTNIKRMSSKVGLEKINKLILYISKLEGLIEKPEGISNKEFYNNIVDFIDTLPKDTLIELQQIEQEMNLRLESRKNAMKRLGKQNVSELIQEIDKEERDFVKVKLNKLNSGLTNGQTTLETTRKEITGKNGGGDIM